MRRWKVINNNGSAFQVGEILTTCVGNKTWVPYMQNSLGKQKPISTFRLVEIDEKGNIVRTYKNYDTLDEGTLVKGENTMNKKEAIERLETIKKEIEELEKVINKPDKLIYNSKNLYCFYIGGVNTCFILSEVNNRAYFVDFEDSNSVFSDVIRTGQELLDDVIEKGYKIHVFTERKKALEFMLNYS